MALPVAHAAFSLGLTRSREPRALAFLVLASVAPDFDFALVWGLGWSIHEYHRTFSHSLVFAALAALVFAAWRPNWLRSVTPGALFAVLASHAVLDMLCTADPIDHGVQLFWPVDAARLGWPVLVPLYRLLADSPFSLSGALRFTALEALLAVFLWWFSRGLLLGWSAIAARAGFRTDGTDRSDRLEDPSHPSYPSYPPEPEIKAGGL